LNALPSLADAGQDRSLVEGVLDAILIADASGRCLAASPAVSALLGYEQAELQSKMVSDLLSSWPASLASGGDRAFARGWRGPVDVLCKGGARRRLEVWATPLAVGPDRGVAMILRRVDDREGVADASVASAIAATEHAERELLAAKATALDANRALRESEARFRGAFDGASIGMALVTVDGRFIQVNPSLCAIVGYVEDELLSKTVQEITHPDHLETDRDLMRQLLANEIPSYQIEKFYLRKQGEVICGRLTASLVRGAGGEPHYFVFQVQDITQFKAAGAALREAEARYRMLVEQTPASVYVDAADALGSPVYVSPRVEALLGFTPEEWLATPDLWEQRVHPDDRERVLAETARANVTGEPVSLEYRFICRDGRVVWVHDEAALVYDDDGSRRCWQGFMIDITDRKRAEEELLAAKEAAEEASRLKTAFLSMATHELRTPLTIISGYVELLAESATNHLTSDEREFLEVTQSSTKHLAALVNDLLDFARIEAGRLDIAMRPLDVAEVMERVRLMVAPHAESKGLELSIAVAPGLPPIVADDNRIVQVLFNLIGNAIKFTNEGSVRVQARPRDAGVEIAVADTGIGIAPEALPQIFDEFHQAESGTTRRFGGTGLGLAIVKRLVEMHGGTIAVESEVGAGSCFTLWFPRAEPDVVPEVKLPLTYERVP
jgi:PAS domain S-box-containing protein